VKPETLKDSDNRAASPFFRAFGGRLKVPDGDAVRVHHFAGSHRMEWVLLSLLIPLVIGVAVFDCLWRGGGVWAAWLCVLPVTFFVLHAMSFVLGAWSPRGTFLIWGSVSALWAVAFLKWSGPTPLVWVAWVWLGFAALQLLGLAGIGWQRMMRVSGSHGTSLRIVIAVLVHLVIALICWLCGGLWGLSTFVGMVVVWALGTFIPDNQLFGPMATRIDGREPLLTIDDGPDPEDTPAILDLLDQHGVKAVFFVIGEKVRRHPELAREIVARGHELANHTMSHPQHSMWCAGPARMRREIGQCCEIIEEVTGQRPRWFRAPVGHRNYFTHPIAAEFGLEVLAWSRRGFDTLDRPVDDIVSDLTDSLGSGEILLLHEATPIARKVVKQVLDGLDSRLLN
jgi:peptidoglycan/xylan/chitin deacetylase (PgdA/CDA1 family)